MSDDITSITFRLPATLRDKIREAARLDDRPEGSWIRNRLGQLLSVESDCDADDEETEARP